MSDDQEQPKPDPTTELPGADATEPDKPAQPEARRAFRIQRGRLALAAAATGLVMVSGLGGFALGHVTADDGRDRHAPGSFQDGPRDFGPGGPPSLPDLEGRLPESRQDENSDT